MTTTNFVDKVTVVEATWLNDVDAIAYGLPEPTGASLVGYLPAGTGAVATTVESKLREITTNSVLDFGATGDGVTDDTTALETAITAAGVNGVINLPGIGAQYKSIRTLTLLSGQTLLGPGAIVQPLANRSLPIVKMVGSNTLDGVGLAGPITAGNTDYDQYYAAVTIDGDSNTVKNCYISGKHVGIAGNPSLTGGAGFGDYTTIENNEIQHARQGINLIISPDPSPNRKKYVRVTGNNVTLQAGFNPTTASDANLRGILVWSVSQSVVANNRCLGALVEIESWYADSTQIINNVVDVWISTAICSQLTISGNVVDYNLRPTIRTERWADRQAGIECLIEDSVISGNVVSNQTGNGIFLANNNFVGEYLPKSLLITNNVITACASSATTTAYAAGIDVLGGAQNITISNNQIVDCGKSIVGTGYCNSIKISGAGNQYCTEINVIGNVITGDRNTKPRAITGVVLVSQAKNVTIRGNVFSKNNSPCLHLAYATNVLVGCTVTDNTFISNAAAVINLENAAILVQDDVNEVFISNNNLVGFTVPIRIATGATVVSTLVKAANNSGFALTKNAPVRGTWVVGEVCNVADAATPWLRCTAAGTLGFALTGATATTTSGSANVTFNNTAAKLLLQGQYISIAGAFTGALLTQLTVVVDAEGAVLSGTGVMNSNATGTVTAVAVTYSAPTLVYA